MTRREAIAALAALPISVQSTNADSVSEIQEIRPEREQLQRTLFGMPVLISDLATTTSHFYFYGEPQ